MKYLEIRLKERFEDEEVDVDDLPPDVRRTTLQQRQQQKQREEEDADDALKEPTPTGEREKEAQSNWSNFRDFD